MLLNGHRNRNTGESSGIEETRPLRAFQEKNRGGAGQRIGSLKKFFKTSTNPNSFSLNANN